MLSDGKKKVQDCDYVFGSSTKFQRRMNGFVKADICRQVSVCLHVFCGILFALEPFCDYSLCSVCILPQPAFYSHSVVCILHSVCILPMVRSLQSTVPQSAFYTDRSKSLLSSLQQLKETLDQKLNLKIPLLIAESQEFTTAKGNS